MIDIKKAYQEHCLEFSKGNMHCPIVTSVESWDDTTLFCPAGMQQFKKEFNLAKKNELPESKSYQCANIQHCLRLNDLSVVGDGTHLGDFYMLGLFSFKDWSLKTAISFWYEFLLKIGVPLDNMTVTIHPDKYEEWKSYYYDYNVNIDTDAECTWSDGIGEPSYCTEFYIKGIEIGNIVNPNGNCIDAGFGLERIDQIVNGTIPKTREECLISTVQAILNSGFTPSHSKQGYVLRKLLRTMREENIKFDSIYSQAEEKRYQDIKKRYEQYKDKFPDKSQSWWWETFGVDLKEFDV